MISRCGHFLVVVLVKINCAQIRSLNASAAQGFELTVEGLEPYHDTWHLPVDAETVNSDCTWPCVFACSRSRFLRSWMSPPTSNPDPMMQPMWTLTANTVLPVPGRWTFQWRWSRTPRCNNRRSPKLRFHLCSSKMLCSTKNSPLKLRPTSNFNNCYNLLFPTLLHHHLLHYCTGSSTIRTSTTKGSTWSEDYWSEDY